MIHSVPRERWSCRRAASSGLSSTVCGRGGSSERVACGVAVVVFGVEASGEPGSDCPIASAKAIKRKVAPKSVDSQTYHQEKSGHGQHACETHRQILGIHPKACGMGKKATRCELETTAPDVSRTCTQPTPLRDHQAWGNCFPSPFPHANVPSADDLLMCPRQTIC